MASNKQKTAKQRQAERKKAKQSKQTSIMLVVFAVVAFTIAGVLLLQQNQPSLSSADNPRLDEEAILGNPDAPITIIEYASYGCPSCRAWHEAGIIEAMQEAFPDQVKFIYRNFPAIMPTYDRMTAELAQCALDQGDDLFWDYHHLLYSYGNSSDSQEDLIQLGSGIGLDLDAMQSCMDAGTHEATVEYHYQQAVNLGLNSAPNFYINGEHLFSLDPDVMYEMIQSELGL